MLEIEKEKCFDPKIVVNSMNNLFLTIASKLVSQIKEKASNLFKTTCKLFKDYYINKGVIPKSFKISQVSEDFVYKELCKLNTTKSTGIDGLKPIFLKDGANIIKKSTTHIVNLSKKNHCT